MDSTKALIAAGLATTAIVAGSFLVVDGQPLEFVEVPKEVVTEDRVVWQFTFQNDKTGEIVTQEVTKEVYDEWLQGSMTIPDYPLPQLDGHTWISAEGEKHLVKTATPTLKKGEFITVVEESATTTPLYKYFDGTKEELTSIKP